MQRSVRRFLLLSTAMLVVSAVLLVGALPRSASAVSASSHGGRAAAAGYRVTLVSCWTNPPVSCAYGGVHAGSKLVTLIATVTPSLRAPLSMRIKGQKYHPSTGPVVLIKNCGQQSRCTASLKTALQGLTAWRFWVVILDGRGRNLLKSADITVAFLIDKPSHLELWINGTYYTEAQTSAAVIKQPLGKPLHLEARWRGGRELDGRYWVRITDGDTMNTACTSQSCPSFGWLVCTTGKVCARDDLRKSLDGRAHTNRIYYAEMFSDDPKDPAPLLASAPPPQLQGGLYVTWCGPPPDDPC
jgi:hypothetical protein